MNFNELCLGCRTYRRFQPKEIDAGILDELMENVRIANSAMNAQVCATCWSESLLSPPPCSL